MSAPRGPLLVVAGEASGDLAAAPVVRRRADAFGMGGDALRAAGCEIVADVRDSTAMGLGGVSARALGILRAWRSITRRRQPSAVCSNHTTEGRSASVQRAGGSWGRKATAATSRSPSPSRSAATARSHP